MTQQPLLPSEVSPALLILNPPSPTDHLLGQYPVSSVNVLSQKMLLQESMATWWKMLHLCWGSSRPSGSPLNHKRSGYDHTLDISKCIKKYLVLSTLELTWIVRFVVGTKGSGMHNTQ